MKKFAMLAAAALVALSSAAQAPAKKDTTSFKFTDVKVVPTLGVRNQNKSGTCWSFSTTSFLENEMLRKGGPKVDLSPLFAVRHCYSDKADKYIRMGGTSNFNQGGAAIDVIYVLGKYGIVPFEVYTGENYGETKPVHGEMVDVLRSYVGAVNRNANRKLSTAWKRGLEGVLDAYMGELPETFTYNGKTYTPQTFAKEVCKLNADDYVSYTSYTHHPFYEAFPVEVADNWLWAPSNNVPMEEMQAIVDNAIDNGYSVAWSADVSEGGFKWAKGFAVLPAEQDGSDLEGTELSRWVKLSDAEKNKQRYDVVGPNGLKEKKVTQETRQQSFDNRETTDDHGMVIVGIAKDQNGNKYYKVKNSWDDKHIYGGYFYVSVPYFLEKTLSILVNKDAVPASISAKMKK